MGTLLTNSKMDPALAARIEASVRGRKGAPGSPPLVRRMVAAARLVLLLTIAFAIYTALAGPRGERRAPERRPTAPGAVNAAPASLADAGK